MANSQTFVEHVIGKVVEQIIFVNDSDLHELEIRFTDNTAFHLRLDVLMEIKSVEVRDWRDGEGSLLHKLR